ncbi:MAG: DUF1624 domain-containing protein [Anaerolineae bacterium]|nr:DUF1624 domain-containing protein [Anaerolineae bacterium]
MGTHDNERKQVDRTSESATHLFTEKLQHNVFGKVTVAMSHFAREWNVPYRHVKFRLAAIDQFRGFAILLMVLANYLAGITCVPAWLKHAPDIGFTVVDSIAPLFIFAIGLTYGLSVRRRVARAGWGKTVAHVTRRYLAFVGIGALLSAGESLVGVSDSPVNWGVLQAIGVAGLLTLWVVRLPIVIRAGIGLVLLAGYQVLLDHGWLAVVMAAPHGGLLGSLSWTAMLILATVVADVFHTYPQQRWRYLGTIFLLLALGSMVSLWVPISKNRVSASYVLVSLGMSGLLFAGFAYLTEYDNLGLPLLVAWGQNPLLLYCAHYILLGLFVLPGIYFPAWYAAASPGTVLVQILLLAGGLSGIAWLLYREGWIGSL